MGFLHQLYLLLWKNVTLKRRSPVSSGGEAGDLEGRKGTGAGRPPHRPAGLPSGWQPWDGRGFLALFVQEPAAAA